MALLGHVSAIKLQEDIYDPSYYAGLYTNVLLDLDSFQQKHHHDKHHHHNHNRDVYDLDPDTVSPYDAMD